MDGNVVVGLQETDEAKEIMKMYETLMAQMGAHETYVVNLWTTEIEATSEEKLKQSLVVRYDKAHPEHPETMMPYIRVNFDPLLLCLLREVSAVFSLLGCCVLREVSGVFSLLGC
jgi:dynein heavy chain